MGEPLKHLMKLAETLRADVFSRWMKRAQKAALIDWRDRTVMPGLAARFTRPGAAAYGFIRRPTKYDKAKGNLPDYVKTGRLRDAMKTRKPRSVRGAEIVTRLRFGGGALNFLTHIGGVLSTEVVRTSGTTTLSAYVYGRRSKKTGVTIRVSVGGGARRYTSKRTKLIRSGLSYAYQFGNMSNDREWIRRRALVEFRRILRGAAFDRNGILKSSVLEPLDGVGE